MYNVIIVPTAQDDIDSKGIDRSSVDKMVGFLRTDGRKIIGKRQQCINQEYDIWYFRIPIKGRGSRGGGRVLYYGINGTVKVKRIFEKKEIDDGKQKRQKVFDDAVADLISELSS